MTISFVSTVQVESANNSGTPTVEIPSGATLCVIGAMWWTGSPGYTGCTISLDGQSATSVYFDPYSASHVSAAMWWVSGFATGADKTFSFDFSGEAGANQGIEFLLMFFSGADTSDPIRDYDTAWNNTSTPADIDTPTIDSSDTDWMVGVAGASGAAIDMTGDGQTERITPGSYHLAYYDCATVAGSGSGKTMTANLRNGGLVAASVKAESGGCIEVTATVTVTVTVTVTETVVVQE